MFAPATSAPEGSHTKPLSPPVSCAASGAQRQNTNAAHALTRAAPTRMPAPGVDASERCSSTGGSLAPETGAVCGRLLRDIVLQLRQRGRQGRRTGLAGGGSLRSGEDGGQQPVDLLSFRK